MTGRRCAWCGEAFEPGGRGKPQRFWSAAHRRAYDQAARDWVRQALASGLLTVEDLRKASRKARALRGRQLEAGRAPEEPDAEAPFV